MFEDLHIEVSKKYEDLYIPPAACKASSSASVVLSISIVARPRRVRPEDCALLSVSRRALGELPWMEAWTITTQVQPVVLTGYSVT